MRGKASAFDDHQRGRGITPAYAGKSCGYFVVCRYLQDHPRVCGEKNRGICLLLPGHGEFSTFGDELDNNYYIRSALRGGNDIF